MLSVLGSGFQFGALRQSSTFCWPLVSPHTEAADRAIALKEEWAGGARHPGEPALPRQRVGPSVAPRGPIWRSAQNPRNLHAGDQNGYEADSRCRWCLCAACRPAAGAGGAGGGVRGRRRAVAAPGGGCPGARSPHPIPRRRPVRVPVGILHRNHWWFLPAQAACQPAVCRCRPVRREPARLVGFRAPVKQANPACSQAPRRGRPASGVALLEGYGAPSECKIYWQII